VIGFLESYLNDYLCIGMVSTFSIDSKHTENEEMCAQNLYSAICKELIATIIHLLKI